ncbi:unnamed protein product, partial [Heterosigma akashiwo]
MTLTDDATRYMVVYLLKKKKNEALAKYKAYCAGVWTRFGVSVKVYHGDNDPVTLGCKAFEAFLQQQGTEVSPTDVDAPKRNARAEISGRYVMEKARCLLIQANLPEACWPFAVPYAARLRNSTLHRALDPSTTPHEQWHGEEPDLGYLHVFGCFCAVTVVRQSRGSKMMSRAKPGLFVGLDGSMPPRYLVLDCQGAKVTTSTAVVFDDNVLPGLGAKSLWAAHENLVREMRDSGKLRGGSGVRLPLPRAWPKGGRSPVAHSPTSARGGGKTAVEYRDARSYKKRDAVAVSHRVAAAAMAEAPSKHTPQSYKEAMSGPDKKIWAHAIVQQLGKWQKRGIGTLVKRQPGMEVVRIRWVFQWKSDGRAKARIAAKGFDQTLGVSYSESFSPTLKMTSLRLFFHLCVEHGLEIFSDDVVAAFISSSLGEDEVYLQVPEGFDCPEGYVLKLRCAVEGVKQSSAKWTTKVDRILDHQGFKAVDAEVCLYYKVTDGLLCLVARYVDDTLSGVHPSQKWVYDALIEAIMAARLELHRLGNAVGQKFLSIQTNWKPGSRILVLDQKDYVRALA